jgi:hypothetical protein
MGEQCTSPYSTQTRGPEQSHPDREQRIIADLLHRFSNLVVLATEPLGSAPSTGQAAYNSLAMEIQTRGMVSSSISHSTIADFT